MARAKQPVSMTFDLTGNFFQRDPRKTFRANIRDLMADIGRQGEAEVKARAAGAGREGAAVIPHINWRQAHQKSGRPWQVSLVISPQRPGMSAAEAKRVMAIGAGRHNPITVRGKNRGRNIGTTKGVEGKTHAWARSRRALRVGGRAAAETLLKGVA